MSRASSGQSIRVGSQVYQINITPQQLEKRNLEKQRERRISRETSKRRKALEERRKQAQLREEKERQTELLKRREKQREATERYQRAHIPVPARRRFSSPVFKSSQLLYQPPTHHGQNTPTHHQSQTSTVSGGYGGTLRTTTATKHSTNEINDIRGYYSTIQIAENEEHSRRTVQKQIDFNQKLKEQTTRTPVPPPQYLTVYHQPTPPSYPKPRDMDREIKSAWSGSAGGNNSVGDGSINDQRAPSRCDRRPSDEISEAENEDLEATFTIEQTGSKPEVVQRSSTPEIEEHVTPSPPINPKPKEMEVKDPRIKKIEVLNIQKAQPTITNAIQSDARQMVQSEARSEEIKEEPDEEVLKPKGILKARSFSRRIVSAGKNGGIVAASIRDSLELATKLGPDNKKNVRWDKLYYNDDSVAEFGSDGKPVHILQTKKRGRKGASTKKETEKGKKGGKKGKAQTQTQQEEIKKMVTRNSQYSVVPSPSSGPSLKTETPLIRPEYEMMDMTSSRIPMPPTTPRPLTSRTQVIRSRRKLVSGPVKVKTYKTNNIQDPQLILNSNNQSNDKRKEVNIHIGSLEINEKLDKTPTDQEINWLWDRVRSALEAQHSHPPKRPKTAPKSSRNVPVFSKSARPTSASAVNSSSSAFILAEQMARRGAPDERILGVINPPMTQLSLEEQQIQESLMRLDNRLLNIQDNVTNNQSARDLQYQINHMFQR